MKLIDALESLSLKFTSGNSIPVSRSTITVEEWGAISHGLQLIQSDWMRIQVGGDKHYCVCCREKIYGVAGAGIPGYLECKHKPGCLVQRLEEDRRIDHDAAFDAAESYAKELVELRRELRKCNHPCPVCAGGSVSHEEFWARMNLPTGEK